MTFSRRCLLQSLRLPDTTLPSFSSFTASLLTRLVPRLEVLRSSRSLRSSTAFKPLSEYLFGFLYDHAIPKTRLNCPFHLEQLTLTRGILWNQGRAWRPTRFCHNAEPSYQALVHALILSSRPLNLSNIINSDRLEYLTDECLLWRISLCSSSHLISSVPRIYEPCLRTFFLFVLVLCSLPCGLYALKTARRVAH